MLLEVELPADRLQRSIDESIRHLGRRTRVPGFRPGKIPRPVLERALGVRRDDPAAPNPIYDDAKEHLFEGSVVEALRQSEAEILPTIPEPEWVTFREGEGATYRVRLQLRPEVRLGDYSDYPFAPSVEEIDDTKIDRVIDQLRDQQAVLIPVEDRGAERGDYAVIGFRATRDGEEFEGGSAERMPLVVGAERMIPGFEEQLLGTREGDEKSFSLRYPDDYPDASLAGREARFEVTLKELRRKQLPDADADFAASVGRYDGLDALRADVRHRLEASARDRARHEFADRIIDYAVSNASVELPDLLVDEEVETMLDELRLRLAEQGIGYPEFLRVRYAGAEPEETRARRATVALGSRLVGPSGAPLGEPGPEAEAEGGEALDPRAAEMRLREEYREPAERRVKTLLVVSEIADVEDIEVPDEEIEAELAKIRARQGDDAKLVRSFESARGRSYLRSALRRTKTVEALVERWLGAHPEVGPIGHLEDEPANESVTQS